MKNKYLILLVGVFIVILLQVVSAIFDAGAFKQDTTIDLRLPCEFNGTFCSTSAVCNFTLPYPNTTLMIDNQLMTSTGNGKPNITITDSSVLGVYIGEYTCKEGGYQDSTSITLEITPTGKRQTTSQGIAAAVFLFLMLALTFLFGYVGFKFLTSDYVWVLGILFLFLTVLFVVYDVWLGYEYHRNWTGIDDGSIMPEIIFYIFIFALVTGLLISGILLFAKWKKLKAWYKRGKEEQQREDEEDAREWS